MSPNFEQNISEQYHGGTLFPHYIHPAQQKDRSNFTPAAYYQSASFADSNFPMGENKDILAKIRGQDLWMVNGRRRNGLIIHKEFYTEFAGPGAAVGGGLDADCKAVVPLGSLSLIAPDSVEEQQKALKIRLQWVRLTQNFTDKPVPMERAQMILEQFKSYFDQSIVNQVPDEAFALLVGVLPYTVRRARTLG